MFGLGIGAGGDKIVGMPGVGGGLGIGGGLGMGGGFGVGVVSSPIATHFSSNKYFVSLSTLKRLWKHWIHHTY